MNVSDFDFALPERLIAQHPSALRGNSRLLVLGRASGTVEHRAFPELPALLRRGDLLVVNNTRVYPARLLGRREPSGGAVECLLLRRLEAPRADDEGTGLRQFETGTVESGTRRSSYWEALVHPGQKLKPGARLIFERDEACLHGEILARHYHGRRTVRLWSDREDVTTLIERIGHVPLPPYIHRDDSPADRERYQTVYARDSGSIAAPTAGLHFTPPLLEQLADRGVRIAEITLHVGYGTFKPVRVDRVEDHVVDREPFSVSSEVASALTQARREKSRVIAVGTTTVRTLESLPIDANGSFRASTGETGLFIYPGHPFRVVDGLVTNFHLPRSSLLMLVAAFAGREQLLEAYRIAVQHEYRFYSYGDAMLIV